MSNHSRPERTEHDAFYSRYIDLVPPGDVRQILADQKAVTLDLMGRIDEEQAAHRYEPGKWSVKEVVGHMVDTERVLAARVHWFARSADGELPSMEQDDWAAVAGFDDRPWSDLIAEYDAVRDATLSLLGGIPGRTWLNRGIASGCEFTVRALAYVVAGHEIHHVRVLQERYL